MESASRSSSEDQGAPASRRARITGVPPVSKSPIMGNRMEIPGRADRPGPPEGGPTRSCAKTPKHASAFVVPHLCGIGRKSECVNEWELPPQTPPCPSFSPLPGPPEGGTTNGQARNRWREPFSHKVRQARRLAPRPRSSGGSKGQGPRTKRQMDGCGVRRENILHEWKRILTNGHELRMENASRRASILRISKIVDRHSSILLGR